MDLLHNPEFGAKLVTLMAAFVLVLQIAMVGQRWLVTSIRLFGAQSREGRFGGGQYIVVRPVIAWSWGIEGPVFVDGKFRTHKTQFRVAGGE